MKKLLIGVLAYQGDVSEHTDALQKAGRKLKIEIQAIPVRSKTDVQSLSGIILPGGESTTFDKLLHQEGLLPKIKKVPCIFGTCAGAIMLAKTVSNKIEGQKTLELMDIAIRRNAYGRQKDSFEETLQFQTQRISSIFIRAPQISKIGKQVRILARVNNEVVTCEEEVGGQYFLASTFHPELTTTLVHEYFLKKVLKTQPQ